MQTLWSNRKARIFMIEGRLKSTTLRTTEPDGLDYSCFSIFQPRSKRRGTMYGNPSSLETYGTFYGAAMYDNLILESESGVTEVLPEVIVIEKFQPFIKVNHFITLYGISDAAGRESNLLFALKSGRVEKEDLDGVGSLTDTAMSSLKRQLTLIAVPSILSILLFSTVVLSMLAGVLGSVVYVLAAIMFILLGIFMVGGLILLKKNLQVFPSRKILADILRRNGFKLLFSLHSDDFS